MFAAAKIKGNNPINPSNIYAKYQRIIQIIPKLVNFVYYMISLGAGCESFREFINYFTFSWPLKNTLISKNAYTNERKRKKMNCLRFNYKLKPAVG